MRLHPGMMALGLIVAGLLAAAVEIYFASAALRGSGSAVLMFILGLWAVWSVADLWRRYARYERILIERGLVDLLK